MVAFRSAKHQESFMVRACLDAVRNDLSALLPKGTTSLIDQGKVPHSVDVLGGSPFGDWA